MSKIKRIEMLFVIFLLSIMLFSCEYSVPPGKRSGVTKQDSGPPGKRS